MSLLGVWVVLIIQSYIASMFAAQTIPYSQFLDLLKAGKIVEVAVTANQIQGKMKVEGGQPGETKTFRPSASTRNCPPSLTSTK